MMTARARGGAGLNIFAHRDCLTELDGKTRGEVIGLVAVQRALAGDERMHPEILKRLWPATKPVEHQLPGVGEVHFTWLGLPTRDDGDDESG